MRLRQERGGFLGSNQHTEENCGKDRRRTVYLGHCERLGLGTGIAILVFYGFESMITDFLTRA